MRTYSKLTREILESYGITEISEDGHIFMKDKELHQNISSKKSLHKDQAPYARIAIPDTSKKIYNPKYGKGWWTYRTIVIPVHRAVYAWYHGEAPIKMDVDHIDNNTLNNHLSNLQPLTREQNNQKKTVSRNQYNYNLTDEEILAKRESYKYVYDRTLHKRVKADWWKKELEQKRANKAAEDAKKKQLSDEWHRLVAERNRIQAERVQAKADGDLERWRELGKSLDEVKAKTLVAKTNI